jgi:uncharacterized protein (UPF0264 family)
VTPDSARRWHGLLVSVRSADEAAAALAGGAAIIDVKEPRHGPLGAAEPEVAAAVGAVVAGHVPWTIACGELAAGAVAAARHAAAIVALHTGPGKSPPAAVKAGPAGLGADAWATAWADFAASLPADVAPVAVAYADWQAAGAPRPEVVIAGAAGNPRCPAVLIDTHAKHGSGLLDLVSPGILRGWITAARGAGLRIAIAGQLPLERLETAAGLGPDVVAVRGAVCIGGRAGSVCPARVRAASRRIGTLPLVGAIDHLSVAPHRFSDVLVPEIPR